ncbi:MAG: HAD-IA family hydrolase [Proteobacteria bacterium]|nr:HAD-IA family hydrolase [Pseudomonadota bacterium]
MPSAAPVTALIWDVDGTLAETERDGHRVAFNAAFRAAGLAWDWSVERYGELLAVAGGLERLRFDMQDRADAPRDPAEREALARRLHALKNACYAEIVAVTGVPLRPGVAELLEDCRRTDVALAIATTTSQANVEALLGRQLGSRWRRDFRAVLCAEDAPRKKPDPQVYELARAALGPAAAGAVAIEDSPAGVAAARAAGFPVLVARSLYFASAPLDGALAVGPSLGETRGWSPAVRSGASRVDLEQVREFLARA